MDDDYNDGVYNDDDPDAYNDLWSDEYDQVEEILDGAVVQVAGDEDEISSSPTPTIVPDDNSSTSSPTVNVDDDIIMDKEEIDPLLELPEVDIDE